MSSKIRQKEFYFKNLPRNSKHSSKTFKKSHLHPNTSPKKSVLWWFWGVFTPSQEVPKGPLGLGTFRSFWTPLFVRRRLRRRSGRRGRRRPRRQRRRWRPCEKRRRQRPKLENLGSFGSFFFFCKNMHWHVFFFYIFDVFCMVWHDFCMVFVVFFPLFLYSFLMFSMVFGIFGHWGYVCCFLG